MSPIADHLARLGGVARRRDLLVGHGRRHLDKAVAAGEIVRVAWGSYALPTADEGRAAAVACSGVAVLLSAAAHWRWPTKWQPARPQIALPRGRRLSVADTRMQVLWRDLPPEDVVDGWVSTPGRTVLDCAAYLPFDEALAVADSALRSGRVTRRELVTGARDLPLQHQSRVDRVLAAADPLAANPFESVLRAVCLDVPGLRVTPQVRIDDAAGFVGRVDLADVRLRLVIEAESAEFHTDTDAFARDCARYDRLAVDGWLVLRFTWHQVMTRPSWVAGILAAAVARRSAVA